LRRYRRALFPGVKHLHGDARIGEAPALRDTAGLTPDGIVDLAKTLDTRINDYRDKEVVHHERHGFSGTKYTLDGMHATIVKRRALQHQANRNRCTN
jgi:hypothetical protein